MNLLTLSLSSGRESPVCMAHFNPGSDVQTGLSADDCIHCSAEWSAAWRRLLKANAWLECLGPGRLAYILGPMSGLPDHNRPAFWRMGHAIKMRGAGVLNPADVDQSLPYPQQLRIGLRRLCDATCAVALTGWVESNGATIEHELARQFQIPIYYDCT